MPAFGTEERQLLEIAVRQRYLRVMAKRITQRRSGEPTTAELATINQLKTEIARLKRGETL